MGLLWLIKQSNHTAYQVTQICYHFGIVPSREKVRCGAIQTVMKQPHQVCKIYKLCVSSWNVGTMHGRASEVVETLGCRRNNICRVQESP